MQKEIPNSQEKNGKAARLREAVRRLQALPLERVPTDAEWDAATADLTQDELDHLKRLAEGYRDRALEAPGSDAPSDLWDEGRSALLLWPRDPVWARETVEAFRKAGGKDPGAAPFLDALRRRIGGRKSSKPARWILPLAVTLVALTGGVSLAALFWTGLGRASGVSPIQGPRNLEAVFDTQGVKTNIQVAQSRMILFPDATVAELSAWVTFPEHRVDVWEGTVAVLDAAGQALTRRDVVFHPSSQGPLEPGQGLEIFEQFDAWPFFSKVASFQVTTTRILAQAAQPQDRKEMPVQGTDTLTPGYALRVWVVGEAWTDRFASKVHTLTLELENSGLKPFSELQLALVWKDPLGKTLKTLPFRPVSAFRTALPSGARLPWTQETVFDTEVFSWTPGQEPHAVLELRQWQ